MLLRHLSIAYNDGGLSALIRQGADCDQIHTILQDSFDRKGISREEARTALLAAKRAKKTKHGRIAKIGHEKFEPALDYFLFNMKCNLVITPTKSYVRGPEETIEQLGYIFELNKEYDEIWRIEGDTMEVEQEFIRLTEK